MKIFLFFVVFVCIALLIGYVLKKEILLYFCRLIKKKTGCSVAISAMGISFRGINFKQIVLDKASFHIEIDSIRFGLAMQRQFLTLYIGNLNCYYNSTSQPLSPNKPTNTEQVPGRLIKNILAQLTNLLVRKYPKVREYMLIKMQHFQFFYQDRANSMLAVEHLVFEKQKIVFELSNFVNLQSKYLVLIRFNRHKILYSLSNLFANNADNVQVAYLKGKVAMVPQQQLTLSAYASTATLNNKKIAKQALTLKGLNILLIIDLFEDRVELNPDSTIQSNLITLEMKGRYNYQEDLVSILLYVTTQVEHLITLLPNLQVEPLKDFKSEGEICVGISLGFLWSDPLHYKFDIDYNTEDLKIITPGVDLFYLQNDFSFKSTINRENHRVLNIAASNGDTENQYLLAKIIQLSEDPNFYKHNGIDEYFIGVAIANNLARKQFFKGASTLSMQLVKNLFLGEEKSLARKLEELILSLLMENHFKISKERILAIYLQLIELGPEIYGIHEAAKFYYNKTVEELGLLECLAISYIIPRPRFFLDALLAKSEQLDHNLSKHIEGKLTMLVVNGIITLADLLSIDKKINFYNIGEFELSNLNVPKLSHLFTRGGE